MKIRKGFVSNSSSSSFVCEVCGEEVSGMDMSLEEAEMYECKNGHTFCQYHALDNEALEERLSGGGDEDEDELSDLIYKLPEQYCPLCHFDSVCEADLIRYLLKNTKRSREDVAKKLREIFPNYKAFNTYVSEE